MNTGANKNQLPISGTCTTKTSYSVHNHDNTEGVADQVPDQLPGKLDIFWCNESEGCPLLPSSASSTNTMDVSVDALSDVKVDNSLDRRNIQSPSCEGGKLKTLEWLYVT